MIKNKNEVGKKQAFEFNSKKMVYAICALVVLGGLVFLITKLIFNNDNKKPDDNDQNEVGPKPDENTVENEYGFTKEEAINIVKEVFKSDNYEFSAEVSGASKYIVTVNNMVDNSKMVFVVDPSTKEYTLQQ